MIFFTSIQAPGTETKTSRTIRLYLERETKWVELLGSMDYSTAKDSRKVRIDLIVIIEMCNCFLIKNNFFFLQIKKLVRLGIPESVRGKAWQFMAGADRYRKPGVF